MLDKADVAEEIVRTLASNLSIPVSAKIRLIKTIPETIAFAKRLADAGAACITAHMRSKDERDRFPARWDTLQPIAEALRPTPVLANGDMYNWPEIDSLVAASGCQAPCSAARSLEPAHFLAGPLLPLERVKIR